jgi:hypothetical protein
MGTTIFDPTEFVVAHHVDCGIALMRCNRHIQALLEFDTVLQIEPTNRYARWNRALALLSMGEYAKGMPEHDWAWEIYDWRALGPVKGNVDRILALPEWKGEKCNLIVYHEMGFGDAIMCLRFLPDLVKRCEHVTLVVRPELVSLMKDHGANVVSSVPGVMEGYDARVTFFNAIWIAGWCHCIPSKPYIPVDLSVDGTNKMGVVWSGNSQKNFTLNSFLSRLDTSSFELYALQLGHVPDGYGVRPLESKSFKETAELMGTMDVIVSVDTAAAHLAGAIGHPNAHVVIPYIRDWRWWNKDIWYPTLSIYPQDDPGDWDTPFNQVNEAIALCIS